MRSNLKIGLLSSVLAAASSGVYAQDIDPVTRAYARAVGITTTEAKNRLSKESEIAALEARLEKEDDYAGMRVFHIPQFKVLVYAKGNAQGLLRKFTSHPLFEARNVPRSKSDLSRGQNAIIRVLDKIGAEYEVESIPEEGTINVLVKDADLVKPALQPILSHFPFARLIETRAVPVPTATFIGGERLIGNRLRCTSGFSVVNASGTRGLVTAAHCGDYADIRSYDFSRYVDRNWGGNYDQAWFTKAGHVFTNEIYTGDTSTSKISIQRVSDPSVGWPVCKYGRSTGQTCGTVESKTSAVSNNGAVERFIVSETLY